MNEPFNVDLGFVIDREGRNIPTSLQTEQWQGETAYAVVFGRRNSPNEPFCLEQLFHYVLCEGFADFEILHEERSCLARIPAGEIRALVRRLMAKREIGPNTLSVTARALVTLSPTPPPSPAFDPSDCPF